MISKYCSSGAQCVYECFGYYSAFKYYNANGVPMQIEVPYDKYDDVINEMQKCIDRGEIKGARRAEEFINKGVVTYKQAKNFFKYSKSELIQYDEANDMIKCEYEGGVSAAIKSAFSSYNDKPFDENSIKAGINFIVENPFKIIYKNVKKNSNVSDIMKLIVGGFFAQVFYYNHIDEPSPNLNLLYFFTALIAVVLIYGRDIINVFRSRMSFKQFIKNVLIYTAGAIGMILGVIIGVKILRLIEDEVIKLNGLLILLVIAILFLFIFYKAAKIILDKYIKVDDFGMMFQIIETEFNHVAFDYLLSEHEAKEMIKFLSND